MVRFLTCLILTLIIPLSLSAAERNAGIVQGLWFSEEPIFAGEPVRVYVAVRNNTGSDLTGSVSFAANGNRFGSMQINALDGRIIEAWADWTPTYGEHTLTADLSRVRLSASGLSETRVELTSNLASYKLFVDNDTDGDGVGDLEDRDDDGDGISDIEEIARGTDPLVPNPPADEDETNLAVSETEDDPDDEQINRDRNEPQGLEEYLAPSRARNTLEQITDTVNTAHQFVDTYRTSRLDAARGTETSFETETADDEATASSSAVSSTSTVLNPDGFGTITRTTTSDSSSWWDTLYGGVYWVGNSIWNVLLFFTASYLAHPSIVQVSLLVVLLYGLYRVARIFGARPS